MQAEQIKESIKLKTEFLKAYFIALVGITTGFLTLVLKEVLTLLQIVFSIAGAIGIALFLYLILRVNKQIKQLILKLN